jgi:hypothetical protein
VCQGANDKPKFQVTNTKFQINLQSSISNPQIIFNPQFSIVSYQLSQQKADPPLAETIN